MPTRYLAAFILSLGAAVMAEEVFSIIPATGPMAGKVKSVGEAEVVFIDVAGKEHVIPFTDLHPRDIYRCRRKLVAQKDSEGLFKLGEYCVQNELFDDAFKVWEAAGKANPRPYGDTIQPAWNALLERLRKRGAQAHNPGPDSNDLKTPPAPTSLRLRILAAGKPCKAASMQWAGRSKLETPHYSIETNVPELTGKYLMLLLEELYKYYGMRLNVWPMGKLRVFAFATREDFERETAAAGHPVGPHVGGFYLQSPNPKQCGIYMPWVLQGDTEPTSVLMHECFHQFYHRAFNTGEPTWLNEGMATYFEACVFDGEKITDAVINASRLESLQEMIRTRRVDSLSQLLAMDHASYQAPQYAEGWGFVYWLAWGQDDKKERTTMQQRFVSFIRALRTRKPTKDLFTQVTGLRANDLEEKWKKWALSLNSDDPFGGRGDPRK